MSLMALTPTSASSDRIVNGAQEDWMEGGEEVGVGSLVEPKTEVVLEGAVPDNPTAAGLAAFMAGPVLPGIPGPLAGASIAQLNAVTIATAVSTSNNTPSGGLVQLGMRDMQVLIRGLPRPQSDINIMQSTMLLVGLYKFLLEAMYLHGLAVGSIRRLVSSSKTALDWVNPRMRVPACADKSYLVLHICVIARTLVEKLNGMGVTVVLVHQPAHCHATDADAHISSAAYRCARTVDQRDSSSYTHVVDVSGLNRLLDAKQLLTELIVTPLLRSSWEELAAQRSEGRQH